MKAEKQPRHRVTTLAFGGIMDTNSAERGIDPPATVGEASLH
jgi:hypothetical protein